MSDQVSKSVQAFLAAHGGSAQAVLQPVGLRGVRVTLVGEDGVMGDEMVADMDAARRLVDATPGLTAGEWDRDLISRTRLAPGHARRMAGWSGRGL